MSEEIKNEDVVATESVEAAPAVEEVAVAEEIAVVEDAPVAEEAPVVEEAKVEEPAQEAPKEVITNATGKKASTKKPGLAPVENGAIGSTVVEAQAEVKAPAKPKPVEDTVAIKSTKNVVWQGVGKVVVGVNIVSKTEADQWLTRNHITLLTPDQVAKEYNK